MHLRVRLCVFILLAFQLIPFSRAAEYNVSDPANHNMVIQGFNSILWYAIMIADLNNNGRNDLIFYGKSDASHRGLFIVWDEHLAHDGFNNIYDFSDIYSVYINSDDGTTYGNLGFYFNIADVNNDGAIDIIAGAHLADTNGKTNNGSIFVIPNEVFSGYTGIGNDINITDPDVWTVRINGINSGDYFGTSLLQNNTGDFNEDDLTDLIACTPDADYNGRTNSGSCYLFENSLINKDTYGNILNLSDPTSYNVRFDGRVSSSNLVGISRGYITDYDQDGKGDLTISNNWGTYEGISRSGAIYLINSNKIPTGYGQTVDLDDPTNYSSFFYGATNSYSSISYYRQDLNSNNIPDLVIYGGAANGTLSVMLDHDLGTYFNNEGQDYYLDDYSRAHVYSGLVEGNTVSVSPQTMDFNNDSLNDTPISASGTDYWGTDGGSTWIAKGTILSAITGYENTIEITESDNYYLRLDGGGDPDKYMALGGGGDGDYRLDLNGDDKNDFVVISDQSKKIWIIYNFPHELEVSTTVDEYTNNDTHEVHGSITSPNSISTIGGMQWSLDNDPLGTWHECDADDGSFDSKDEDYTCDLEGLGSDGLKTVYFRAYDENESYTAVSHYSTLSFTQDTKHPLKPKLNLKYQTQAAKHNGVDKYYDPESQDFIVSQNKLKLYFDVKEETTEVEQIMVCERQDFRRCAWKSYDGDYNIELANGEEKKRLYFKFKDSAGNISDTYSQLIKLDQTAPELTLTKIGKINYDSQYKVYYYTVPSPVLQGETEPKSWVKVWVDGNLYGDEIHSRDTLEGTWRAQGSNLTYGRHNLVIESEDPAGNKSILDLTLIIDPNY